MTWLSRSFTEFTKHHKKPEFTLSDVVNHFHFSRSAAAKIVRWAEKEGKVTLLPRKGREKVFAFGASALMQEAYNAWIQYKEPKPIPHITLSLPEDQAKHFQCCLADILCWTSGWLAANPNSPHGPIGREGLQELNILLKKELEKKDQ